MKTRKTHSDFMARVSLGLIFLFLVVLLLASCLTKSSKHQRGLGDYSFVTRSIA